MNLKQLRCICVVAHQGYSISKAALSLHTTQPALSTQIRLLEEELDTLIFERHGKRILGLTPAGEEILKLSKDVVQNINSITAVGEEFNEESEGVLTIATTHTQARYALPKVITSFSKKYPKVQLRIRQGNPTQISEMLLNGDVDIAIATETIGSYGQLAVLPVYRWNRCVIAPPKHPLLKMKKLTLAEIAKYPIVTYDYSFAGRSSINKAFEDQKLKPNIVLTAIDSDVIKHYVELGLGIGILANMAYDPVKDKPLKYKDASHLFEDSTTSIGVKKGRFLRSYMYEFIEMFAQHLTRDIVQHALKSEMLAVGFELQTR